MLSIFCRLPCLPLLTLLLPPPLSLVNVLRAAQQAVPEELLKFGTTVKKKAHDTYGAFFKDVDMSQKGTKITFE